MAWDGSPAGYTDEQYRRACVLDRGADFSDSIKERFGLPVRDPDGSLNCQGVAAARQRIGQVEGASAEQLAAARAKLEQLAAECDQGERSRPTAGEVEERTAPLAAEGRKIRGLIPYSVESRDLGGWREVIEPGALRATRLDDLVATVDHAGVPIGRYPTTLELEDRADGLSWALTPPQSRADVVEAVERGDLRAGSWRMVVGRDRWQGDVRHVESIAELQDVSVVTRPAYGDGAPVEYRAAPENTTAAPERQEETEVAETTEAPAEERAAEDQNDNTNTEEPTEEPAAPAGGLRVEDRTQREGDEVTEARVMSELADAVRRVEQGESRALTGAISLAPTAIGTTLFDRLRAAAVVLRSGVRVIQMPDADSITYPTLTADVAPATVSEGGTITPGDPTFSSVTATPRKVAHLIQVSNEVLDDSTPPLQGVLTEHLTTMLAYKLDQQLLEGDGTPPNVRGLKNVASIQTLAAATNGQAITFDNVADAIALLEAVNVPLERMAFICHPRNIGTLRKLKASTAGSYLWSDAVPSQDAPRRIFGVPVFTSPQLSTNETQGTSGAVCNSGYLFDTENVVWVNRQNPEVVLDRSRLFNSDQSELRATLRGDLIAPSPSGIVRITGFTS